MTVEEIVWDAINSGYLTVEDIVAWGLRFNGLDTAEIQCTLNEMVNDGTLTYDGKLYGAAK